MRLSERLVKNVLSGYLGYATLLLNFFVFPFVVGRVGAEVYGIWVLTWAAVGYFELLDLGVSHSVARFVADRHARGDTDGLCRLCSSCLALYSLAGLAALGLALLLSGQFASWFDLAPEHARLASTLVLLAGARMAVSLPARVFSGTLTGLQRLDLNTYLSVGAVVATTALTVIVLLAGRGIVAVGVVTLVVGLLSDGVSYLLVRRLAPELKLSLSRCNRGTLAEVMRFSLWILANRIAIQVNYKTDALVIGYFLPQGRVTVYQVGLRLADLLREFPTKIAAAVFPAASHLSADTAPEQVSRLATRGTRYSVSLFAPMAAFFMIEGEDFIRCWMGSNAFAEAAVVLRLLLVAGLAAVAQNVLAVTIQAVGQPALPTWVGLFDAAANLALSLLLVRRYGLVGVAVGTTVPLFLSNLVVMVPLVARRLSLPLRHFLRDAFAKPVCAAAVCAGLLTALDAAFAAATWGALTAEFLLFSVAYAALLFALQTPEARREDMSLLRRVFARGREGSA